MKSMYLFPSKFKLIGWLTFIPSVILGVIQLIWEYEPSLFNLKMPALYVHGIMEDPAFFIMVENNMFNEFIGVLIIVGGTLVAFSQEKVEDEFIAKTRLESLVWATYINYAILLLSLVFVYELGFWMIMVFNMFTVLFFFVGRFHWQLWRINSYNNYDAK